MRSLLWFFRLLVLALILTGVGAGVFNAVFYPRHGLEGFTSQEYNKTLLKAATLYAVSMNMSVDALLESDFETLGEGKGDFAWGIARLQDRDGHLHRLWVSIQRPDDHWHRASTNVYPDNKSLGLLVDPLDQLFFLKDTQPNMKKTRSELDMMVREQTRRFREYFSVNR